MKFVSKEWRDRLVEFAGRRSLAEVSSSGSTTVVDVTRNEGQVSQEGDAFNATNMNNLEQRITAGFDSVAEDLNNLKFRVVDELPSDAANHADTIYIVLSRA